MVVFEQYGAYVCVHGKSACSLGVVPLYVNACKLDAHPVGGDRVVLLEGTQEVFSMSVLGELDAEVIYNEDKSDGPPFMMPQAWSCSTLVVSVQF